MSMGLMSGRSQKVPGKYTSWKAETPPEMQNLESVNLTTEGGGELSFSRSQMQREQAQRVFGGLPAADLRKVQQKHTPWGAGLIWKSRGSVLCCAGEGPGDAGPVTSPLRLSLGQTTEEAGLHKTFLRRATAARVSGLCEAKRAPPTIHKPRCK